MPAIKGRWPQLTTGDHHMWNLERPFGLALLFFMYLQAWQPTKLASLATTSPPFFADWSPYHTIGPRHFPGIVCVRTLQVLLVQYPQTRPRLGGLDQGAGAGPYGHTGLDYHMSPGSYNQAGVGVWVCV